MNNLNKYNPILILLIIKHQIGHLLLYNPDVKHLIKEINSLKNNINIMILKIKVIHYLIHV
jgi:hypothetical protein